MANKKKLKKRKKRQLKRAFKQAGKVVKVIEVTPAIVNPYGIQYNEWILPAPVDSEAKHKDKDKAFQVNLDSIYNGTVKALTHYVNDKCTMVFQCDSCGLIFFGKAGHLISDKEHQRHECYANTYGDIYGERNVSSRHIKKKNNKATVKRFNQMIWDDYTPQEIAKELKLNSRMVIQYFKEEGLIE